MNKVFWVLTFLSLGAISSNPLSLLSAEADETTHSVKVYTVSSDVTAPELLPINLSSTLRSNCRERESGNVRLSLVVDETGKPRNVFFVRALAQDLDKLALQVVLADRFIPGRHDGAPVAVGMLIDLNLVGCVVREKSDSSEETLQEHLNTEPVQKLSPDKNMSPSLALLEIQPEPGNGSVYRIGDGVSAPVPINTPEAKAPLDRSKWKTGVCLISMTVDANGMPQSPTIVRSVSPEMDQRALAAVHRFRFRPAMKDEQPVQVEMKIELNFKGYD